MLSSLLFFAFAASVYTLEFDTNIKVLYQGFNEGEKRNIRKALKEFSSKTCLKFQEKDHASPPYVKFKLSLSSHACYSFLGAQARGNDVVLSRYCTSQPAIVQKEFMHALGFTNEHNRSDRGDYVTIIEENIFPSTKHNFKIRQGTKNMKTAYDYRSVLHYKKNAFSKNGKPTIVAKDHSFNNIIGNAKGLSDLDVAKVNANFC